ncbi:protein of unknown function (plasmid) [Caballeronia sp. S22]
MFQTEHQCRLDYNPEISISTIAGSPTL